MPLGQGAEPSVAQEFAHMGVGVADTEGIHVPDDLLWGWSGDNKQSIGPFQLYKGGLGAELNGDTSPQNQLAVAASTMWNGDSPYYNTGDWFGVSRQLGVSPSRAANDSIAGQNAVEALGAKIDQQLGLSDNVSAPDSSNASVASADNAASSTSSDTGLSPIAGQGTPASSMFDLSSQSFGPSSLQKLNPISSVASSTTPTLASGVTNSGYGAPIVVTDVTSAGYTGLAQASQSVQTAGQTVKQGAEDVGQKIQTSEQQFAQTVSQQTTRAINQSTNLGDWFAQLTSGASGLVARIGVGLAAIMLIGIYRRGEAGKAWQAWRDVAGVGASLPCRYQPEDEWHRAICARLFSSCGMFA